MRIGWFGGSFDPPHRGHLAVAAAAAEAFGLARVLFAPVGKQPLKTAGSEAAFADRVAMVRLLCAGDRRFAVSELDGPREDGLPNYTVDALRRLRTEEPEGEVFGLLGVDAFGQMRRWREPEALRELAEWIVVTRPGYEAAVPEGVHLLEGVWVDMAASALRARLRAGDDCVEAIPGDVLGYIREHGLYAGESIR